MTMYLARAGRVYVRENGRLRQVWEAASTDAGDVERYAHALAVALEQPPAPRPVAYPDASMSGLAERGDAPKVGAGRRAPRSASPEAAR